MPDCWYCVPRHRVHKMKPISVMILWFFCLSATAGQDLAIDRAIGNIEVVATFSGPMPTGVTVANSGRIFVNFPRWGDQVEYTVAEIKNGKSLPFPNAEINRYTDSDNAADKLVSVQSVVVDPTGNRLWMLDTGTIQMGPAKPRGPKPIGVDLSSDQVAKKITFPSGVALSMSYLNDVPQ